MTKLLRQATAELIGTALLVCVVVGSGIMGNKLSSDVGVALVINTGSTILTLALLIFAIAPISGAHFNPVVTMVQLINRKISPAASSAYIIAQLIGGAVGATIANVMFDLPAFQISGHARVTAGTLIGEVIATAGLIALIGILTQRHLTHLAPIAVATWIGSAAFFTSSTSFANPAVTFGRMFSDTFAGIAPDSVLPFIGAQVVGALIGLMLVRVLGRNSA